jgi:AcrR family transcriptional regulator
MMEQKMPEKENVIEKRITETFLQMASDMPIEKISVSQLCRSCGIQRQTFYNHYDDMDALIEAIFEREGHRVLEMSHPEQNWQESLCDVLSVLKKNRDFVNAVYQGVSREQLESRLHTKIFALLDDFIQQMDDSETIKEEDRNWIIEYHTFAFSGYILDWIRFGMKLDPQQMTENIDMVIHGSFHEAIERYAVKDRKDH